MITKCKKLGRFLGFCPILYLSGEKLLTLYQRIEALVFGQNLDRHRLIMVLVVGGCLLWCSLMHARSVMLYTYDEQQNPVYLCRLPVVWGEGLHIYLPAYFMDKSETGRFFLEFQQNLHGRDQKKNVILYMGRSCRSCKARQIIGIQDGKIISPDAGLGIDT